MPTATSGLYKVIVEQTMNAQELRNVFWYWDSAGDNGVGDSLATQFNTTMIDAWTDFTSTELSLVQTRVVNYGTTNVDEVLAISDTGDVTGNYQPPFVAAVVRLFRGSKDTRDGWKRFAGIPTSGVADGLLTGTVLTNFNAFSALLDNSLTAPSGSFVPVIVKRSTILDGAYPVTYSEVIGTGARPRLSTQNSRKVGVGQ